MVILVPKTQAKDDVHPIFSQQIDPGVIDRFDGVIRAGPINGFLPLVEVDVHSFDALGKHLSFLISFERFVIHACVVGGGSMAGDVVFQ